jgi:7-cyano-7-deazaguanine synthase in queuosine biosynthesis
MNFQINKKEKNFEEYNTLVYFEQILKQKRGFSFKMPQSKQPVILLLSGGLDSICLWNYLMGMYRLNIYPLFFFHPDEIYKKMKKSILFFSDFFKKLYPDLFHQVYVINYPQIFSFENINNKSKLITDLPLILPNLKYNKELKKYLITIINSPARLGHYAFGAYEYAHILKYKKSIDIQTIFTGIVPSDGETLRESTLTVLRSINISFCLILGNWQWQFTAPIERKNGFYISKKELAAYAIIKKLPLEKTWSCTQNAKTHCGYCHNCKSRKKVFKQIGFIDKTKYKIEKKLIKRLTKFFSFYYSQFIKKKINFNDEKKFVRLEKETMIAINKNLVCYEINKIVFFLNKKTGLLGALNESGSMLFLKLNKKSLTVRQLVKILSSKYGLSEKQSRKDIDRFLKEYIKNDCLVID